MIVSILLVEHLFEKKPGLCFEISNHLVVVCGGDQLLEFVKDLHAATWVIRVLSILEVLDLHE